MERDRKVMKILLVAVNAKYIHSNLAVYSLRAHCKKYQEQVQIMEYTINNRAEDILKGIYKEKPDVVAFSCYIWNISMIDQVAAELRKVLPETRLWAGGPEVSYNPVEQLETKPWLTGVMVGEGEETFSQFVETVIEGKELETINGIVFRKEAELVKTPCQKPLDISTLPFAYENFRDFENKIIYYETSRGCPYSCSYCLSSIEKGIRLRDMRLIKKELKIFLDNQVPQVKFIDRTFNCNHDHAMEIWRYIYDNDNGITNFHFEISADLLKEEQINLIKKFRPGLIQFEIGVQSVYPQTITAIHRTMNLEKLSQRVKQVKEGGNIHQHLDLIAGLPYEDYLTFQKSFDYVYRLKPDQLQLGFLKVLKGSAMFEDSKEHEIQYTQFPPYEVLSTRWMTYDEILELKKIEEMVEIYYNSGQFTNAIAYLEHFFESPFALYKALGDFYHKQKLDEVSHARISRYYILLDFFTESWVDKSKTFEEILLYDLYLRENLKSRPNFGPDPFKYKDEFQEILKDEEGMHRMLPHYAAYNSRQISRMVHLERFSIDIEETVKAGQIIPGKWTVLFDYEKRNPLNHQASVIFF